MTAVDRVAALLRDSGAAYAQFDPSATDGQCWIIETESWWFTNLAEQIVELVKADVKAAPTGLGEPVAEHAALMAGGGMHVRPNDPDIELDFPLADWIRSRKRQGGKVYRRTVAVVEGWTEVTEEKP